MVQGSKSNSVNGIDFVIPELSKLSTGDISAEISFVAYQI